MSTSRPDSPPRPYVTLSCAMSIDGYLDDTDARRLTLSNAADLDRVDDLRARSDAILVGATTLRRDNPRLMVRDAERRERRVAAGLSASPTKVTVTSTGDISPDAAFFTTGACPRLVYCPDERAAILRVLLRERAVVVGLDDASPAHPTDGSHQPHSPGPRGPGVMMARLLDDLATRGVRRLLVEGGGSVLTQFLAADLVDELQLVIAPVFVGDAGAPRVVRPAHFPWTAPRRARLAASVQIGDVVLLRYALSDRFCH